MVLDTTTMTWHEGGGLPMNLTAPTSVSTGESVLLLGGFDGRNMVDQILQWDPDQEIWNERPERLSTPRNFAAAVVLSDEDAKCQ